MKSVTSQQQSRYGTLTVPARLGGWYEVLHYGDSPGAVDHMFVLLPTKPQRPGKLAKELRAIAKHLDGLDGEEHDADAS